jgi:nucleotide-binding universal stress UspA family protein
MNPIETILLPTKLEMSNTNTILYAVDLAKKLDAELILLHAYYLTSPTPEVGSLYVDQLNKELSEEIDNNFRKIEESILKGAITKYRFIKKSGGVDKVIKETAAQTEANLVIMGGGGDKRAVEGFESVTYNMSVAILVVPKSVTKSDLSRIMLASDPNGMRDLEFLEQLADHLGSRLFVLSNEDGNVSSMEIKNTLKEEDRNILALVQLDKALGQLPVTYVQTTNDITEDAIIENAKTYSVGLIVLFARNHGFWRKFFEESTTKKMTKHSPIPLLIMPDRM